MPTLPSARTARIGVRRSRSAMVLTQRRHAAAAHGELERDQAAPGARPAARGDRRIAHGVGVAARGRDFRRAHRDQPLAERRRLRIDGEDARAGARAAGGRLGALEGAADARRQADIDDRLVVRAQELEGAPEIARRRQRGLRMQRVRRELADRTARVTGRSCRGSCARRSARAPAPCGCRAPPSPSPAGRPRSR